MTDRIWLKGVECRVRLGVSKQERARRQRILVDAGLDVDLRRAQRTSDLRHTVDYAAIEQKLRGRAESGEFNLAERLAGELALEALRAAPSVRSVRIAVHKRPATMPKTREVVVEVRRGRSSRNTHRIGVPVRRPHRGRRSRAVR